MAQRHGYSDLRESLMGFGDAFVQAQSQRNQLRQALQLYAIQSQMEQQAAIQKLVFENQLKSSFEAEQQKRKQQSALDMVSRLQGLMGGGGNDQYSYMPQVGMSGGDVNFNMKPTVNPQFVFDQRERQMRLQNQLQSDNAQNRMRLAYDLRNQFAKDQSTRRQQAQQQGIQTVQGMAPATSADYETIPEYSVDTDGNLRINYKKELSQAAKLRQEREKEAQKPLSDTSAIRYSGAMQGVRGIREINKILGLTDVAKANSPKTKDLIYRAGLAIEAANAKPTWIPGGQGAFMRSKLERAGDDAVNLSTYFMNLAENLLRARTGAAAPDPEVVRELARTMLRGYVESPRTWINKLKQAEEFMYGIGSNIKPNSWNSDLDNYQSATFSGQAESGGQENRVGKYTYR